MIETKFMMRALIDFFGLSSGSGYFYSIHVAFTEKGVFGDWVAAFSSESFGSYGDSDGG